MMAEGSNPQGYRRIVRTYAARDLAPEAYVPTDLLVRTCTHNGSELYHYIALNKIIKLNAH
jgi:hypothetical protein